MKGRAIYLGDGIKRFGRESTHAFWTLHNELARHIVKKRNELSFKTSIL